MQCRVSSLSELPIELKTARQQALSQLCGAVTIRFKAVGGAAELPDDRMRVTVRPVGAGGPCQ